MRFTPQFLDELKARLPVSEVVGRRVKLIRSGRELKGLSPFNKEKTPSFFVNDQKEAWFDFSSGKNGSIFDFIMLTEGVAFPGSGRAAGADGGRRAAGRFAGRSKARRARQDLARGDGDRGEVFRNDTCVSRGRESTRLSRRPWLGCRDASAVSPRLCAGRTLCAEGALGRTRHFDRRHGGSGVADRR